MTRHATATCTRIDAPDHASMGAVDDADLLARYLDRRDERAFEALVRRHGPRVLRTCRGRLGVGPGSAADVDDAFQATFVVLVRGAAAIRSRSSLGPWLQGVADRVSLRALGRRKRLRSRETQPTQGVEPVAATIGDDADRDHAVREEVERLPESLRRAVHLCYWEGLTNDEAARRLGCPPGTLRWRLARAREVLDGRLARRGIAVAALLLLIRPIEAEAGQAVPSERLVWSTVDAAGRLGGHGSGATVDHHSALDRVGELADAPSARGSLARVSATALLLAAVAALLLIPRAATPGPAGPAVAATAAEVDPCETDPLQQNTAGARR